MASLVNALPMTLAWSRTRRCSGAGCRAGPRSAPAARPARRRRRGRGARGRRARTARPAAPPGRGRSGSAPSRRRTAECPRPGPRARREPSRAARRPARRAAGRCRGPRASPGAAPWRVGWWPARVLPPAGRGASAAGRSTGSRHGEQVLEELSRPSSACWASSMRSTTGIAVLADPVQEGGPGGEQVLAREAADRADPEQRAEPRPEPGALLQGRGTKRSSPRRAAGLVVDGVGGVAAPSPGAAAGARIASASA